MNQFGRSERDLTQIGRDSIQNNSLISFGSVQKGLDDYDFFVENWERLEADQVEILVAFINDLELLYKEYKSVRIGPRKSRKECEDLRFKSFLCSFGIFIVIAFYFLLSGANIDSSFFSESCILSILTLPIWTTVIKSESAAQDVENLKGVSQTLVDNRPQELQGFDYVLMVLAILLVTSRLLKKAEKRIRNKEFYDVRSKLVYRLEVARKLYSLLNPSRKKQLSERRFDFTRTRYGGATISEWARGSTWDELETTKWLRKEFDE